MKSSISSRGNMSIGIGISTTPNRQLMANTIQHFYENTPPNFGIIVEEDKEYTGVAATKNRLLAKLDTYHHIFLFDDDTYPIANEWWKPYMDSEEPHLMYQFKLPGKPKSDMKELYRDGKIVAYSHTRGAMIYIKRIVLDVVGGLDEDYGEYGYEHPDWTNRIFNAGLTTHRAMDVPNSKDLLYCLDQDSEIESSVSADIRKTNILKNYNKYKKSRHSREYKDYK